MYSRAEYSMFKSTEVKSVKQLEAVLSETIQFVVGYEPYLKQRNLQDLFSESNSNAENFIAQYLNECDVNVSNNLGMTLLHILIWAKRPDLAKMIVESPKFNKMNYKFSLPVGMAPMYASALDLAIALFLESAVELPFIELLLQNGAKVPNPEKKFLNSEFTSVFYPHMVCDTAEIKPKEELTNLFCLLHRYGFSISGMEANLNKRLFSTENSSDNRAQEFSENYGMSVEEQKTKFTSFIDNLKQKRDQTPVDGVLVVELTAERLDNGEHTLNLPFDPHDRPCVIM